MNFLPLNKTENQNNTCFDKNDVLTKYQLKKIIGGDGGDEDNEEDDQIIPPPPPGPPVP